MAQAPRSPRHVSKGKFVLDLFYFFLFLERASENGMISFLVQMFRATLFYLTIMSKAISSQAGILLDSTECCPNKILHVLLQTSLGFLSAAQLVVHGGAAGFVSHCSLPQSFFLRHTYIHACIYLCGTRSCTHTDTDTHTLSCFHKVTRADF